MVIVSLLFIGLTLYLGMKSAEDEFRAMTKELRQFHVTQIECLKKIYKKNFDEGYKRMNVFVNIPTQLAYVCQIFFCFGGVAMSYFVLHEQYPLPTFYVLSFYRPNGWCSWFVNTIDQNLLCNSAIRYFTYCVTFVQYVAGITMANFDTTIEIVQEMKMVSDELNFNEWVKIVSALISTSKR